MTATTIPAKIHISQDGVYAGTGRLVRHADGTVTVEDCFAVLGPDGLDHESGEQQDAAERAYEAIEAAIARGESSVTVDGCTYTWTIEEPPAIEVLGLGMDDWGAESDPWESEEERAQREAAREWERYGTVRVRIGEVEYEVGVAIGVPEYLRATAEAAGGDTTRPAYLAAWYVQQSDWSCAPASSGQHGVPAELADAVLEAIYDARVRLWREYETTLHAEAETDTEDAMKTFRILWGHSGEQGRHWTTAREASRYAAEEWGTVEAESPEAAVEIVRAESPEGTVGDWYVDGRTIHIVPVPEDEHHG